MQQQQIKISLLKSNSGQVEGLPKNPRLIKSERFTKLVKSIQEDPEMLELRELIVYPFNDEFVVIAGNMRLAAMKELKYKEAPCKVLDINTTVQKLKAYVIKDNVGFGEHDWDMLANEWDEHELIDWGLDLWNGEVDEFGDNLKKYNDNNCKYPISPKYSEKYDAIIIISDSEIDTVFIKQNLDIGKMKSYKNKTVGESFVINAKDFIKLWNAR